MPSDCAPQRHFSVEGADGPFALVPEWFWGEIAARIAITCNEFDACLGAYHAVPLASHEGAIIAALDAGYAPADLINLAEAEVVNTLNLHQEARAAALAQLAPFFREVEQLGYLPLIRSFYRSFDEQGALIDNEPTAAAPAGYSMHQSGLAFDLWTATAEFALDEPLYTPEIVALAERHGIVHPMDWDRPHYFALDAVYPGATAMLRAAGIEPHDDDNVDGFLLGLLSLYEARLAALDPARCTAGA
jgi:hypothetical protein